MLNKLAQIFFEVNKPIQQASWCSVCDNQKASFLPLSEYYHHNASHYGFEHLENMEMLSLDEYSCNYCNASDRERLYALWIDQHFEKKIFSTISSIIHFAPEAVLSKKLKTLGLTTYKTADLLMDDVDYKVDIMAMPFEDESFDFFICSHVLEHVDSDDNAIKELYRITKSGGCGILMAPIVIDLEKTLEDRNINDEAGRWKLYGQHDHVRLYAHDDYVNKISSHSFRVEELGENHFGKETFRALGLTRTSILYVVHK